MLKDKNEGKRMQKKKLSRAKVQQQDHFRHAGMAVWKVPFMVTIVRGQGNGEREGLGPVRANTSLRSLNISYRKNGAPGTFWRGRYNLIRAPGNWLRLVLGGTGAPCSGVGSPVRGHCDGSVTLNGQGSHGGGEET